MQKTSNQKTKKKSIFSRLTKWGIAALCVVLGFFIVGACTIGGFSSPGKAYFAPADSELVFYLDYADGEDALGEIYINVGAMYDMEGENVEISFRHSDAAGEYSSGDFRVGALGDLVLGNVFSSNGEGVSGANYNWVRAFDLHGAESTITAYSYRMIRITVPCDMLINEVVFLDTDGDVIDAYADESTAQTFFLGQYWHSYRDLFHRNDRTSVYGALGDPSNLTDSPRYVRGGNVYTDFTQDEMYTLMQIDNIRLGSILPEGYVIADTDAGPLSTLLSMLGVLVFGVCPFGLRILPVICTAALIGIAYLFGKELFGKGSFALLFACLFAAGGLAITVGRLGLYLVPAALCTVLAYYFMYRFFRRGAALERPLPGARNILYSGLCFAFAFALDPKSIFALLGLAALLVAGIVRLISEKRAQLSACAEGAEPSAEAAKSAPAKGAAADGKRSAAAADASETPTERRADAEERVQALQEAAAYRGKLFIAFVLLGFVAATVVLYILGSLPLYFTYVRMYESDPSAPVLSIFSLMRYAFEETFVLNNATAYTAVNASSAFGWLIGLKGATLFSASGDSVYAALNAQPNIAMTLTSLIAFAVLTVFLVLYGVTGGKKGPYASAQATRILGAYIVLTAGMLTSLLQFAFSEGAGAGQGMLFQFFYLGYIPLLLYASSAFESGASVRVFGFALSRTAVIGAALVVLYAAVFALSLPMYFGIPLAPAAASVCFGWTTFINNGFYRM